MSTYTAPQPMHGCSHCATSGGVMSCPYHGPVAHSTAPAGVAQVAQLQSWSDGFQLCALGFHAWVPWLQLPSGSWTTWCARSGCDHAEQYDL